MARHLTRLRVEHISYDMRTVPRAKRWGCAVMLDWKDEEGQKQHWHKRLDVTGPRQVGVLGGTSDPQEASEVVLGWHKAFGGPGDERNPLGVGHASRSMSRYLSRPSCSCDRFM